MSGGPALRAAAAARAKRIAGSAVTVKVRCLLRGYGLPLWGNLRRTTPFSSSYGSERGTPIDRHYLHAFLSAHRDLITGDVLEVQTNDYTGAILASVAVHDPRFPVLTTIVARIRS